MKQLNKKGIKEINDQLQRQFSEPLLLDKKQKVIVEDDLIIVDGKPWYFSHEKKLVPTLRLLQFHDMLPKITVDMGAVKFVIKGADIMRPGVTNVPENLEQDGFVAVIDETHHKTIAVGKLLFSSVEVELMTSGKVIQNIHYVGDPIWKLEE